jgi:hypothetical protein
MEKDPLNHSVPVIWSKIIDVPSARTTLEKPEKFRFWTFGIYILGEIWVTHIEATDVPFILDGPKMYRGSGNIWLARLAKTA